MIQLEQAYKTATISLNEYFHLSSDWMMKLVKKHETSKKLHSTVRECKSFLK